MNRDSFLFSLKAQFADEIAEALVECKHGDAVDWTKFDGFIAKLGEHATVRGLSRSDFDELVRGLVPEWRGLRKAA